MSDIDDLDDSDFILKTAENTEKFVVSQVKKVSGEMKRQSKRVDELESQLLSVTSELDRVKQDNIRLRRMVESKECPSVKTAFEAGLAAIEKAGVKIADSPLAQSTPSVQQVTAGCSKDVPANEKMIATKLFFPMKRKAPLDFKIIDKIEDLAPSIAKSIQPFYKEDKRASADYLNDVQRAFIKYRTKTVMDNKEPVNLALVLQVIREGEQHRIWHSNFQAENMKTSFEKYLMNRLKNEKKVLQRKSFLDTQSGRLSTSVRISDSDSDEDGKDSDEPSMSRE